MDRKRQWLSLITLLCVSAHAFAGNDGFAALGDKAVTDEEYHFYLNQTKPDVTSEILREYGLKLSDSFWETPLNGKTPSTILKERTLHAIARDHALQKLALDAGLIGELSSFDQLVELFHAENKRRKEMKARGEVFYGPVRFRQDVWFKIHFEQLKRALEMQQRRELEEHHNSEEAEALAKKRIENQIRETTKTLLGKKT